MNKYITQCLSVAMAALTVELFIAQKPLAESLFFAAIIGALMPIVDKASSRLFNWLGVYLGFSLRKKDK